MNREAPEFKRVTDEMFGILHEGVRHGDFFSQMVEQIISIKGLAILADDQTTPLVIDQNDWSRTDLVCAIRLSMSEANFRKVI